MGLPRLVPGTLTAAFSSAAGRYSRGVPLLLVVLIGGILIFAATVATQRSFLVEARTGGLTVTFNGNGDGWSLDRATVCRPLAVQDPRAATDPDATCPSNLFSTEESTNLTVSWRKGTVAHLRSERDGALVVEIGRPSPPGFDPTTQIVVPRDTWQQHGALAFRGEAVVGGQMKTGSKNYLLSGRWEAREEGVASSLFGRVTDVVRTGNLSRGVRLEVYRGKVSAPLYGYVTPVTGETVLDVTFVSEPGDTEMRLNYFGAENSSVIRPDWIDSTLASPVLLAAIAILTVLALLFQILTDFRTNWREDENSQ